MFARLGAKALILTAAVALIFFGIGLLGMALASALTAAFGPTGADALAGGTLVLLGLLVVGLMALMKPRRPPPQPASAFVSALLGALARDLPWAAVLSAGLAGVTELLLKRGKNRGRE
ncbi:MAG: hypothetical protein JO256_13615 [Alphaproteobacteria bacterium]|nr:hypothetical protein [Alphaproteobacteria bacterium]